MSLVDSTVKVKRGGSYLTIPANAVERYLAKGYDVVDEQGNVIKSVPNDINALKLTCEKQVAEIKMLKERIYELEHLITEPKVESKPTTTRKSKKS